MKKRIEKPYRTTAKQIEALANLEGLLDQYFKRAAELLDPVSIMRVEVYLKALADDDTKARLNEPTGLH